MANFPGSFDSDATLYVAVNNLRTTLTSSVSASELVIPVVTTSGFPPRGFVTLTSNVSDYTNPEAVAYSGIDTTNFYATSRGADGTVAKPHNVNARADLNVVAAHHNQLKDAVKELEYFVGVSGAENFLRVDDFGNVIVPNDLTVNGHLTAISGAYSQTLTVSGIPVMQIGGLRALKVNNVATEITGPVITLTGTGIAGISNVGNTITIAAVPNALVGAGITSVTSGTNITTIRSTPNAIVGGLNITVTSGTTTTTIAAAAYPNVRALIGAGITSVTSGTNIITIRSTPLALVGDGPITITSGTNTIIIGSSASGSGDSKALVGSDGITITSGTSTITITGFRSEFLSTAAALDAAIDAVEAQLPAREDFDFVSNTVDMGGGQTLINENFNNRSLIQKLKVSPVASGVAAYLIQFYTKNTFSFDDRLEYEATASGIYVDNDLWFHQDEDLTGQIHLRITNNSLVNSAFHVEMRSERFD